MNFWKRTSPSADGRPMPATHSSSAEAGSPEAVPMPAPPADTVAPDSLPAFSPPPAGVSVERSFCQNGFVWVPQVFDQTDMAELRRAAIGQFPDNRPPFEPQFNIEAVYQEPFRLVFRNRKFIQSLRTVLGDDFVFVNNCGLHDSFYVGWHTDTATPEGKGGHEFHWSPGFCVVQVATYLQDNGENGGGLDVVPGSHVRDDVFAAQLRRENGFPVAREPVNEYASGVSIPSRAGDVVIFHLRLSHRASRRRVDATADTDRKLAMFMVAGANNALTRRYSAWLDEYAQMTDTPRTEITDEVRSFLSGVGHSIV
jgi:hypothetical protein